MIARFSHVCSFVVLILIFSFIKCQSSDDVRFFVKRSYHRLAPINETLATSLSRLSDEARFEGILRNILIPRVVGSVGHEQVKQYLVDSMRNLDWQTEENSFNKRVPHRGRVNFTTVVAKLNPDADRYLVLACHYDSKYMQGRKFLAATDSAVPCAMMIDLATSMADYLKPYRQSELSLMMIFFDGEEAFDKWSDTDSLYGARHLAKKWQNEQFLEDTNQLHRMDVLVLLDLLGAPNPNFYSFFDKTKNLHYHMADIENSLAAWGQLAGRGPYFHKRTSAAYIEDDHIPFAYARTSVPILHVIPTPFPDVWHTLDDTWDALDFTTIGDLNKMLRVFTASYLDGRFDLESFKRDRRASDSARAKRFMSSRIRRSATHLCSDIPTELHR